MLPSAMAGIRCWSGCTPSTRALAFPTISAAGDHLQVAVIADYGQPSAELLTGRIALADLA